GGYERVKGEVLEDVFLARHVKASGGRLLAADGKELFSIRMYHSLDEIWNGWKKNMFTAMRKSVPRAVFHIAAVLAFLVT
ncbi:MAG: glycosyl transferase, partial [Nitrospinaceae bacterium]|nr:glycosyl transferase [Nitrospinaceae bacterium]NIS88078.1 glycosyl transferase [Nitrospinaceae bacterium]NIT84942.1 glycosyl transferase [Nitrospinaceae bacterium]NIU99319.1 glycosyl transferase [Nitrospinaceae bacterium]NIY18441.1 glycosyl transferase [Nitrospinaceae bacterium]